MDLFESMKQTQSHNGFHSLNGVKSPGKDLQAKVPTVFLVDDISDNEDVILESKTQTLTLVIYPGKSKKDREPVPNDSKQGESEVVPNSDEGPNSSKEVDTHESVSVSKEVAKHLEKDLFGNEREEGEDEKQGPLAVSRTGHSEPVSADETNDDIREDLYGHQSEWSDKQGSLLTVAKREIITIGKEESHGLYPGDLPRVQNEEKSETARALQDLIDVETGVSNEEGDLLASPTQKEKLLICKDCSKILVPGSVSDEDIQEGKLPEEAKSIEPASTETRSDEGSEEEKPLDEPATSETIEIGKTSLEKMVNGDKAVDAEETSETNEPVARNLPHNALAGDDPDSKEETKEAVTRETITICKECREKNVANEEVLAGSRVSSLTPHHMSEYPDDIRESIAQEGLDAVLDAIRQPEEKPKSWLEEFAQDQWQFMCTLPFASFILGMATEHLRTMMFYNVEPRDDNHTSTLLDRLWF